MAKVKIPYYHTQFRKRKRKSKSLKQRITIAVDYINEFKKFFPLILNPALIIGFFLFFNQKQVKFSNWYEMTAEYRVISPNGFVMSKLDYSSTNFNLNKFSGITNNRIGKTNIRKNSRIRSFPGGSSNQARNGQNQHLYQISRINESDLLKSNSISDNYFKSILFDSLEVDGIHDYVINHLTSMISADNGMESLGDSESENDNQDSNRQMKFQHKDFEKFDQHEIILLSRRSYQLLRLMGLQNLNTNPESGITEIRVQTSDISLTLYLFKKSIEVIRSMVYSEMNENKDAKYLQQKHDSLLNRVDHLTYQQALNKDRSLNVVSLKDLIPLRKISTDLIQTTQSLESLKALLFSTVGGKIDKNKIEFIDRSYFPVLVRQKQSRDTNFLYFPLIWIILSSFFVFLRKYILDVFN